jgi:putative RecB family exonuclease
MSDNILVSMDRSGIHIVSPEVSEKLENKKISASMITSLSQCPARWAADSFAIPELVEQEPDNPARRGSLFHKVMEDFFKLDPAERTPAKIREISKETLFSEDFKDFKRNPEVIKWLKDAIDGYYSMGGKPKDVKVANVQLKGSSSPKKGLEIFVKGKIGDTKRDTLGFIDRLIEAKKPNAVIIEDWKTGAKAKHWKESTKGDEGLAEQRQQIIYSMIVEQSDIEVSKARLIYPVAREIVNVELDNEKLRKKVIESVEETDRNLDTMIDNNTFELQPNFLCAWCPLAKICPAAQIKPYAKMQEAYAKQPDPEVLLKGIELK